MGIVGNVLHRVNTARRNRRCIQGRQNFSHCQFGRPSANGCIQFFHALHTPRVARQIGICTQILTTNGRHQSLENTVAIAGNQGTAIFAKVCIGRRNTWQSATSRTAHGTKLTELRQQTFHAIENCLVKGDVDHLPKTTFLLFMQGHQNTDDTVQRGQGVANTDADPDWQPAGLAT